MYGTTRASRPSFVSKAVLLVIVFCAVGAIFSIFVPPSPWVIRVREDYNYDGSSNSYSGKSIESGSIPLLRSDEGSVIYLTLNSRISFREKRCHLRFSLSKASLLPDKGVYSDIEIRMDNKILKQRVDFDVSGSDGDLYLHQCWINPQVTSRSLPISTHNLRLLAHQTSPVIHVFGEDIPLNKKTRLLIDRFVDTVENTNYN